MFEQRVDSTLTTRMLHVLAALGIVLTQLPPATPADIADTAGGDYASDLITLPDGFDQAASDPRAVALAMSGIEALGGWERWQAVRALKFSFHVERGARQIGARTHHWDRVNQRHRVDMKDKDGAGLTVVRSPIDGAVSAEARRAGVLLAGKELDAALEKAREAWVNDAHWLLMPFRAFEPGAHLDFVGRKNLDGRAYYVVKLTFEDVGRTPGDAYWAWYDAKSRRMDLWQYRLWSAPPAEPPSTFRWSDWTEIEGLRFSLRKTQRDLPFGDEGLTIRFQDVEVLDQLPDRIFDSAVAAGPVSR